MREAAGTLTRCRQACWTLAHIMTWLGPGGYCRGGRVHDGVLLPRRVACKRAERAAVAATRSAPLGGSDCRRPRQPPSPLRKRFSNIAVRYELPDDCFSEAEVTDDVKRYKFQALVTVRGEGDGDPGARLGIEPRRMVLRGRNEESGHSQLFSTLVSCEDGAPFRPDSRRLLVTLRLAGDDVADYLEIGGHFDLWLGGVVGHGVVTRRLFV